MNFRRFKFRLIYSSRKFNFTVKDFVNNDKLKSINKRRNLEICSLILIFLYFYKKRISLSNTCKRNHFQLEEGEKLNIFDWATNLIIKIKHRSSIVKVFSLP